MSARVIWPDWMMRHPSIVSLNDRLFRVAIAMAFWSAEFENEPTFSLADVRVITGRRITKAEAEFLADEHVWERQEHGRFSADVVSCKWEEV